MRTDSWSSLGVDEWRDSWYYCFTLRLRTGDCVIMPRRAAPLFREVAMRQRFVMTCVSCALAFAFAALLAACSSGSTTPDGDQDTEDLADLTDELPAVCVGVDCGPGECRVADGEAYCHCPNGYHQVGKVHCVVDAEDGDKDPEPEAEQDEEREELSFDEYELPILPNCDETDGETFPCYADLDFTELNDEGLFRIASDSNWTFATPHDVRNDWFGAFIRPWRDLEGRPYGSYLVHLPTHKALLLAPSANNGSYIRISDSGTAWQEVNLENQYGSFIYMDFQTFLPHKIYSEYDALPKLLIENGGHYYWTENLLSNVNSYFHLYTLNDLGEKQRLDNLGLDRDKGIERFEITTEYLAYNQLNERIIYIELATYEEHIIDDAPYLAYDVSLWGDKVYWSDATDAPENDKDCGFSIIEYDISTKIRRMIVDGSMGVDKWLGNVWENWLVYADFGRAGERGTCRIWDQSDDYSGEIVLHHLPTGLEWEITDNEYNDEIVRMWGRWMIWKYSRNTIHGMDLCKHPELKYYINQCPDYTGEPTVKSKTPRRKPLP